MIVKRLDRVRWTHFFRFQILEKISQIITLTSIKESGVFSFGFPYSSRRPALIMAFLSEALGPSPHFRGYTSRSMITRLIFATTLILYWLNLKWSNFKFQNDGFFHNEKNVNQSSENFFLANLECRRPYGTLNGDIFKRFFAQDRKMSGRQLQ